MLSIEFERSFQSKEYNLLRISVIIPPMLIIFSRANAADVKGCYLLSHWTPTLPAPCLFENIKRKTRSKASCGELLDETLTRNRAMLNLLLNQNRLCTFKRLDRCELSIDHMYNADRRRLQNDRELTRKCKAVIGCDHSFVS